MALPDLIEIVPLTPPVAAEITVPGSKSITNRALILAALAGGEVTLQGALWSEDTQVMTEALVKLGFEIKVVADPDESCNRTITVKGLAGKIPNAGTIEKPLELFVGNAGTAARFLAAFVCLGQGVYRLSGVPRMHERPQAALFAALRELGYRVESAQGNDKVPVTIWGEGRKAAKCSVSVSESSQFASALILCGGRGGWEVGLRGTSVEEQPYVEMTNELVKAFPHAGGRFQIEPDASGGSYFWGAGWLLDRNAGGPVESRHPVNRAAETRSAAASIAVRLWPASHWQIDTQFNRVVRPGGSELPGNISRARDLGDSIMTAIALAPFNSLPVKFTDLGRLRVQECERVAALRTELTRCGANVVEEDDTLTVFPARTGELHGAEIETYHDHRMAMCFAVLGLKIPGIKLKNPACVKKTFPNFFQKLAAPPPHGLGAGIWEIRDGRRARRLDGDDLFAG